MKKHLKNSPFKKVAIIYKRSVYQKYFLDEKIPQLKKLARTKKNLLAPMKRIHEGHYKVIKNVEDFIDRSGIAHETEARHLITNLKDFDLVITVGGDGTFLRSTHNIDNQYIFGINSYPKISVGALCSATQKDYKEKLFEILKGNFEVKEYPLMKIKINNKSIPIHAVNDVLFTNFSPAAMSRYIIKCKGIQEEHKSSGIWIATATGSSAAIHAAGGMKVHKRDTRLQFVTREPYQGIYNPYRLIRGFVEKNQKIKITNKMFHSRIYIDGPTTHYRLSFGDEITFQLSNKHLKVIA